MCGIIRLAQDKDIALTSRRAVHRSARSPAILAVLALSLGGCAVHNWAPGPGLTAADFQPAAARCRLMARHSGSDFSASGSPKFVAGAAVGYVIGDAVRSQADFNDCMLADGWQIADGPATAPIQPVAAATLGPAAAPPQPAAAPEGDQAQPGSGMLAPKPSAASVQPTTPGASAIPSQTAMPAASATPAQPITSTAASDLTPPEARTERAARAVRVADAWLQAQRILDQPDADWRKGSLYLALCGAGDRSSCFMAAALDRSR